MTAPSEKIGLRLAFLGTFAAVLAFNAPIREGLSVLLPSFAWLDEHVLVPVFKALGKQFGRPYVYPMLALILFWEWRYPARPQKTFSIGFVHDAVWFVVQVCISATLTASYVAFLRAAYREQFDFLTIRSLQEWPFFAKFLVWLAVSDFLMWFHHWVRHKVPWFWHFHTVHHSQKQMNLFTDMRYHAFEYLLAETIMILPMMATGADVNTAFGFGFFHRWFTRLYHANIRSNFGPLRYILVTPQSHRIHHSVEPRHTDVNFGVFFSVWDRLFGTHYEGKPDEYPETGIRDKGFPLEGTETAGSLLLTPVRQHLYPFQAIGRDLKEKFLR